MDDSPTDFTTPASLRIDYPQELPISACRAELVQALRDHQVLVVAGETGSGKTTQLPKMCLEALGEAVTGAAKVGCTQPRRIAALSVSRRIAEELGVVWGREVGCKIRFSDRSGKDTRIKVMTDGILLAESRSDPLLRGYCAIIIDEAHERSLNIDFLIGYLKTLVQKRPDLKVIITSATLDTDLFSRAFGGAPIIEVSGRLFPVEIRYQPEASADEDLEAGSYIDNALRAVDSILGTSIDGDILVFMPTEQDIRETCDRLAGRYGTEISVLPLMGSLPSVDQERVFRESARRKVVVATNVAETSLTIPGIRFVVDTGLARISRYNPRSRTKRLPVERVSQSSANQRAGRAGRVREGVCIRLFSEEDYRSRPEYSDPEIRRANLAEVILRMKFSRLGPVEEFPFLNPPERTAVRSGYTLLQELGALDENRDLTALGRDLAMLPVDPTIGRILLQAKKERSPADVLVIAAGLSIQDPRERPFDARERALNAQRIFAHPDSDFLTLLNLWNAFEREAQGERRHGALRRFCKTHYLSYMRMREWSDVYSELADALRYTPPKDDLQRGTSDGAAVKRFDGTYRTIHRALLAGLLRQVALRAGRNLYRASHGREVTVFPGSALSEKREKPGRSEGERRKRKKPPRDQWVVFWEFIETSRLFGRMCAPVVPAWIEEVGRHLCKRRVEGPFWNERRGLAEARETVTLYGLTLAARTIEYARVDRQAAKEALIRHVLLYRERPIAGPVADQNRRLCDKLMSHLSRHHSVDRHELEDRLCSFYSERLPSIASVRELEQFLGRSDVKASGHLLATPGDLLRGETDEPDPSLFPDTITLADTPVELHYRYEPGGEYDGVTLRIPLALARSLPAAAVTGIVPGLRPDQVRMLLNALPKEYRKQLPAPDAVVAAVIDDALFHQCPLAAGIREVVQRRFGLDIPESLLSEDRLPDHLRPRFEVYEGSVVLGSSRDLAELQRTIVDARISAPTVEGLPAWQHARAQWEQDKIEPSQLNAIPDGVEVTRIGDVPLYGYLSLAAEPGCVALRLLASRSAAVVSSYAGMSDLLKQHLIPEIQRIRRESRRVEDLKEYLLLFAAPERLRDDITALAISHILDRESTYPPNEREFIDALAQARAGTPGAVSNLLQWIESALKIRSTIVKLPYSYAGMRKDLDRILPPDFLRKTPYHQVEHLSRYLRAILVRAERARNDPVQDQAKARRVQPYLALLEPEAGDSEHPAFRWMIEEFVVAVFAPELKTAYPISEARLDRARSEGKMA